jgi:hypothetical protein
MTDEFPFNSQLGAIVCNHVHEGQWPILQAVKSEPLEPLDSGWQFHCNLVDHTQESGGKLWLLKEVMELEPTLAEYMELPAGTVLDRASPESAWEVTTD